MWGAGRKRNMGQNWKGGGGANEHNLITLSPPFHSESHSTLQSSGGVIGRKRWKDCFPWIINRLPSDQTLSGFDTSLVSCSVCSSINIAISLQSVCPLWVGQQFMEWQNRVHEISCKINTFKRPGLPHGNPVLHTTTKTGKVIIFFRAHQLTGHHKSKVDFFGYLIGLLFRAMILTNCDVKRVVVV